MSPIELGDTLTTAELRQELFGVHIPELQLDLAEYRAGLAAAQLAPGERYLELGSGHGRGLLLAATEFEVGEAVGVEYLDDAADRTMTAARKAGVDFRVRVERADVRAFDPRGFDVVHMHLGPAFHDVLAARLERLLAPDTRVVAAGWRVPGWHPIDGTDVVYDGGYVYRPADPLLQLRWRGDEPSGPGAPLVADVHADLAALEVRVDDRPVRGATVEPVAPRRGQVVTITLPDGAAESASGDARVTVWARGRDGRITQRGGAVSLRG